MDGYKVCTNKECGKLLPLSEFYYKKNGKPILPCIKCKKRIATEKHKISKIDPIIKNKIKEYKKNYYKKHKEKILSRTSKYYIDNKLYYQDYQKKYEKIHPRKNRKKNRQNLDINQKIRCNISRSISKKIRKNGTMFKHLSYSFQELKEHLESQFETWMDWNNYGIYNPKNWDDNNAATWRWQVDHIIPHSEFPYTSMNDENFKKCWALDNLRPYSAKQNILDGTNKIRHKKGKRNE